MVFSGKTQKEKFVSATEKPGNHDYHGPTKPDPDNPKRRVPVANPEHKRFHEAIGDVMAGKIIAPAREQMRKALDAAPKDPQTDASTSRPMPEKAVR
jgi:hypothetical protein